MTAYDRFVSQGARMSGKLSDGEELRVNVEGQALEKAKRIDEAVALYEYGVVHRTGTPFTYDRLLVLYRKAKRLEDERRVCVLALERFGPFAYDCYGEAFESSYSWRLTRIDALRHRLEERKDGDRV
jgi:hypothetical protein